MSPDMAQTHTFTVVKDTITAGIQATVDGVRRAWIGGHQMQEASRQKMEAKETYL